VSPHGRFGLIRAAAAQGIDEGGVLGAGLGRHFAVEAQPEYMQVRV
jgi:hypothetical protein